MKTLNDTVRELTLRLSVYRHILNSSTPDAQKDQKFIAVKYNYAYSSLRKHLLASDNLFSIYPDLLNKAADEIEKFFEIMNIHDQEDEKNEFLQKIKEVKRHLETNGIADKIVSIIDMAKNGSPKWKVIEMIHNNLVPNASSRGRLAAKSLLVDAEKPLTSDITIQFRNIFESLPQPIKRYEGFVEDILAHYNDRIHIPLINEVSGDAVILPFSVHINLKEVGSSDDFIPKDYEASGDFKESIFHARTIAYRFLIDHGLAPGQRNFRVIVTPLVKDFKYVDKSAGLPIALAIVGKALEFKMNPAVAATGVLNIDNPTGVRSFSESDSLKKKIVAASNNNLIDEIIFPITTISEHPRLASISWKNIRNFEMAVKLYFGKQWEDFLIKRNKITCKGDTLTRPNINKNKYYIERKRLLEETLSIFKENNKMIIQGLTGIGKTYHVEALINAVKDEFKGVFIYNFYENDTQPYSNLEIDIAAYFKNYGNNELCEMKQKGVSLKERMEMLIAILKVSPFLIVMDNFNNMLEKNKIKDDYARQLMALIISEDISPSKILIVSNEKISDFETAINNEQLSMIELKEGFSESEGIDFIRKHLRKNLDDMDLRILKKLIIKVEGHPKALEFIIALKDATGSFSNVYEDFEQFIAEDDNTIESILRRLLLKVASYIKIDALLYLSVFRRPISWDAIKNLRRASPNVTRDDYKRLSDYFLIEVVDGEYSMHSMVREYSKTLLKQNKSKYRSFHKLAGQYYIPIYPATDMATLQTFDYEKTREAFYHCEEARDHRKLNILKSVAYDSLSERASYLMWMGGIKGASYFLEAKKIYRKMRYYFGVTPNYFAALGYCIEKVGNKKTAEWYYRRALAEGGKDAAGRLALLLLSLGRQDEAYVYYKRALDNNWDYGEFYIVFANHFVDNGDLERAEELLQKAIQICPRWDRIYLDLSMFYLKTNKAEEAKEVLCHGLSVIPTNKELFKRLCLITYDYAMTSKVDLNSFAQNFTNGQVYIAAAEYFNATNQSISLEILDMGIKYAYADGSIYVAKAQRVEEKEAAIKILELGIKNAPTDGAIYTCLANLYAEKGKLDEAIKTLGLGIKNAPTDGKIYTCLANLYAEKGKLDEAIKTLELGMKNIPACQFFYTPVGKLYFEKGILDKAETNLGIAINLRPSYITPYVISFKLFINSVKVDKAKKLLGELLQNIDFDENTKSNLKYFIEDGDLSSAIALLELQKKEAEEVFDSEETNK